MLGVEVIMIIKPSFYIYFSLAHPLILATHCIAAWKIGPCLEEAGSLRSLRVYELAASDWT